MKMQVLSKGLSPPSRGAMIHTRRSQLVIQANTLWSLAPRQSTKRSHIDLTGIIGTRRLCCIAAKDYSNNTNEPVDFTVVDHGGLHIIFEAEGISTDCSTLFVTDVDSACDVAVDGQVLPKGEKIKLRPGAKIDMGGGEEASYVVMRNISAHA